MFKRVSLPLKNINNFYFTHFIKFQEISVMDFSHYLPCICVQDSNRHFSRYIRCYESIYLVCGTMRNKKAYSVTYVITIFYYTNIVITAEQKTNQIQTRLTVIVLQLIDVDQANRALAQEIIGKKTYDYQCLHAPLRSQKGSIQEIKNLYKPFESASKVLVVVGLKLKEFVLIGGFFVRKSNHI